MAGLGSTIHVLAAKNVDARPKAGHDDRTYGIDPPMPT